MTARSPAEAMLAGVENVATDWTGDGRICGSNSDPAAMEIKREVVDAALTALDTAGFVVVPKGRRFEILRGGDNPVWLSGGSVQGWCVMEGNSPTKWFADYEAAKGAALALLSARPK